MTQAPDPFAPPKAELGAGRAAVEPGSGPKAVLVAFLANMGASVVLVSLVMVAYAVFLIATGHPTEEIADQFVLDSGHPVADGLMLLIDGASGILGGFICARIARHSEYKLAAILTVVQLAAWRMMTLGEDPSALTVASMAVTVATTMLGAWLGRRLTRRVN